MCDRPPKQTLIGSLQRAAAQSMRRHFSRPPLDTCLAAPGGIFDITRPLHLEFWAPRAPWLRLAASVFELDWQSIVPF